MKGPHAINRRHFLKSACAAGAAVVAAGFVGGLSPLALAAPLGGTRQQSRLLMGTIVTLTAVNASAQQADEAFAAAFAEMERHIAIFDRHNGQSALSLLNARGALDAPEELAKVLAVSCRLSRATNQAFNPAVAPVVDLFEKARAAGQKTALSHGEMKEALALADPARIALDGTRVRLGANGMALTLDGIAKGFIADSASHVLAAHGLADHMVNAGGDIRVSGRAAGGEAWKIGIQHPSRPGALLATAAVSGGGIATSGSYENYYDRARSRHHLISHLTGNSADIASVTVRAQSAMQADALATALALMPPAEAVNFAKQQGARCLIADNAGRYWSHAWS